jgi:hypothetical protein
MSRSRFRAASRPRLARPGRHPVGATSAALGAANKAALHQRPGRDPEGGTASIGSSRLASERAPLPLPWAQPTRQRCWIVQTPSGGSLLCWIVQVSVRATLQPLLGPPGLDPTAPRPSPWAQPTRRRCWIVQVSIRAALQLLLGPPGLDPRRYDCYPGRSQQGSAAESSRSRSGRAMVAAPGRSQQSSATWSADVERAACFGAPDPSSQRNAPCRTSALYRRAGSPSLESDEARPRLHEIAKSESLVGLTTGVKLRGPEGAQRLRATSASTTS